MSEKLWECIKQTIVRMIITYTERDIMKDFEITEINLQTIRWAFKFRFSKKATRVFSLQCDKEVALILIKLTSQNSSIPSPKLHLSSDRKKNI